MLRSRRPPPAGRWRWWRAVVVGGRRRRRRAGGGDPPRRRRPSGRRARAPRRHGGKLAARRHDGFTFDVGPSLLTLPACSTTCSARPARRLAAELDLVRLDPQFHYRWPDGGELVVPDGTPRGGDVRALGARCGCGVAPVRRHGRRDLGGQRAHVPRRADGGRLAAVRRMRSPRDLVAIDPLRTLHRCAAPTSPIRGSSSGPGATPRTPGRRRSVRRPRWRASRTSSRATAAGTRAAGSTRCGRRCSAHGAGSASRSAAAPRSQPSAPAGDRHRRRAGRRRGDRAAGRRRQRRRRARLPRPAAGSARCGATRRPSTSGLVVLAAVAGRTPVIDHHNVWFSDDDAPSSTTWTPAAWPMTRRCTPASRRVTDPSQAPAGGENWFLLVNTPPGIELDAAAEARLCSSGWPTRRRPRGPSCVGRTC